MTRAVLHAIHAHVLITKTASICVLSIVIFDYTELKI
jgi:hypothetical protein